MDNICGQEFDDHSIAVIDGEYGWSVGKLAGLDAKCSLYGG